MNKTSNNTFFKLLNHIGGLLIFFGIAFFISTNWDTLTNFIKISATLGAAIAAYLFGLLLFSYHERQSYSSAFFMLAGLLLPVGIEVTLQLSAYDPFIDNRDLIISSICLTLFLITQIFLPRILFLLFIIIFGSLFFISLLNYILRASHFVFNDLFQYQLMTLGLSYILLANYLNFEKKHTLSGSLFFFGTLFLLSGSYLLGGLYYFHPGLSFWKIITIILIFSTLFLSTFLKSKSMLYLSVLFLIAYLVDMSSLFIEIFGKLGWPLILVSSGFLLMILAYIFLKLLR